MKLSRQGRESLFSNREDTHFHPLFPRYSVLYDDETVSITKLIYLCFLFRYRLLGIHLTNPEYVNVGIPENRQP